MGFLTVSASYFAFFRTEHMDGAPGDDTRRTISSTLSLQIESALAELSRPADSVFLSALSAGLDLGFGPLLVASVLTLAGAPDALLTRLLVANAYTVGFVFVVLGRAELFTEHATLAVLPVLDRRSSLARLGRLWGLVYAGNIVGGALFAGFAVALGPAFGMFDPSAFGTVTEPFVSHGPLALFGAAILAGWLMGLLSWLVAASRDTISRVFFVWLVTFVIGFAHLPHCIAGNIELLAGLLATSGVTAADYGTYLLVTTVGNTVGGTVFVALLKYGFVVRGGEHEGGLGSDVSTSAGD